MSPTDFSRKLDLVLKALSLSRGRLAVELGVAKSLVSRWVSGTNAPSAHNLGELTALIARRRPEFVLLDWDRELPALASLFGVTLTGAGSAPTAPALAPSGEPDILAASRAESAIEVQREGMAYPGVYVGFRLAFRNTGEIVPDLLVITRLGDRLLFRQFDPVFSHSGEILILRHQIFIVGEDDHRVDGLTYYLLNGVSGHKAMRIDGLSMTVHNGRLRTPTATTVVLQRLADLEEDGAAPTDEYLAGILTHLQTAFADGTVGELAGPTILAAIFPTVGAFGAAGFDYVLRRSPDACLSVSELDWNPTLEADVRRLRSKLLGEDDCFPIYQAPRAPRLAVGP